MKILVVNAGSSTYKIELYDLHINENMPITEALWQGSFDYDSDEFQLLAEKVKNLVAPITEDVEIIGHRVVHGGDRLVEPVLIDEQIKQMIEELSPLAPLHNPANLTGIKVMEALFPGKPQVAVFDTAFHRTISPSTFTYALPMEWKQWGIRVYGFHGISHQYCSRRAAEMLGREDVKIISCHLGNGSSIAAIQSGLSIDTTMGFTPLDGVMMGSRCGSIDPGILLYLQRVHHFDAATLDHILNYQSGLKGICGFSDFREVLERREGGDEMASLAYDRLIQSLVKNIGAMVGSLGGLDVLLFTGGIGENAFQVRRDVCVRLAFLGLQLDEEKNNRTKQDGEISKIGTTPKVLVIHTREDYTIARACLPFAKRESLIR
jgi:acetate kinase